VLNLSAKSWAVARKGTETSSWESDETGYHYSVELDYPEVVTATVKAPLSWDTLVTEVAQGVDTKHRGLAVEVMRTPAVKAACLKVAEERVALQTIEAGELRTSPLGASAVEFAEDKSQRSIDSDDDPNYEIPWGKHEITVHGGSVTAKLTSSGALDVLFTASVGLEVEFFWPGDRGYNDWLLRGSLASIPHKQGEAMPKDVDRYHDEVLKSNPDYSEAQAWATAWSIFCRNKDPGSEHCKKPTSEYLSGKNAGLLVRVASAYLDKHAAQDPEYTSHLKHFLVALDKEVNKLAGHRSEPLTVTTKDFGGARGLPRVIVQGPKAQHYLFVVEKGNPKKAYGWQISLCDAESGAPLKGKKPVGTLNPRPEKRWAKDPIGWHDAFASLRSLDLDALYGKEDLTEEELAPGSTRWDALEELPPMETEIPGDDASWSDLEQVKNAAKAKPSSKWKDLGSYSREATAVEEAIASLDAVEKEVSQGIEEATSKLRPTWVGDAKKVVGEVYNKLQAALRSADLTLGAMGPALRKLPLHSKLTQEAVAMVSTLESAVTRLTAVRAALSRATVGDTPAVEAALAKTKALLG